MENYFSLDIVIITQNLERLQSLAKYSRQTLVFMWNSTLLEKFNFCFSAISGNADRIFISWGGVKAEQ